MKMKMTLAIVALLNNISATRIRENPDVSDLFNDDS